jgi:hypothetical protein
VLHPIRDTRLRPVRHASHTIFTLIQTTP